jgi:uncharacterized membrane protein
MTAASNIKRNGLMTSITPPATGTLTPQFVIGSLAFTTLATLIFAAAAMVISGGEVNNARNPGWALAIHVSTVVPAFLLGAPILLMKKGTRLHKLLGRIWAAMMMITAISSFWLSGMTGHIGPIHVFSVVTIASIPWAVYCARTGNIAAHQRAMTGTYIGLLIAGLFSFMPGRLMANLVAGLF